MKCPHCGHEESKVTDSRPVEESIKRRRECLKCQARFTTYETIENINNLLLASLDLPFVLISISERLASSRIKLLRRDDNSPFLTLSTVPWFPAKSPTSLQTEHTYPHNSDSRSFSTKALSNYQWIKLNVLVWFSQKACFAPLMLHNSINLTTQNSKRVPTH